MNKKTSTRVFFIDGYSSRKGLLGIVSYPYEWRGRNIEYTIFLMTLDGQWVHQQLDFNCTSVIQKVDEASRIWCLLGKNGQVAELRGDHFHIDQLPGTGKGKYGYMEKICVIDKELYACGDCRQVYKQEQKGWVDIAKDIKAEPSVTNEGFLSMDGTSANDIYLVGDKGQIFYYDGKQFTKCKSPTKEYLNEIKCVSPKEVWIVGSAGTILYGSKDKWETFEHTIDIEDGFYGVELFKGKIYISGYEGVFVINGHKLDSVNFGLKRKITTYKLRAQKDLLWSIGEDDIFCYDGEKWEEIICPENQ